MRHEQLKNHIKGSFLKEQYLEAFLVQSAYIESLLKIYADFNCWKSCGGEKMVEKPIFVTMYNQVQKYNLSELIDFLYRTKLISGEQKHLLNQYREKRNKVLHDLIKEIGKEAFEKELQDICIVGNKIIDSEEIRLIINYLLGDEITEEWEKYKNLASEHGLPQWQLINPTT